ncbi:MAG: hypothetical protein CO108_16120 [Deltaproteobacteria bacterium CG_4_9_14_3_um_filter_63_12]|nr:MAG: hypothetical protein CO108_16120 [Deltaproteobacteria bacterium CG_4_9_14_3_um_filter_63_12]
MSNLIASHQGLVRTAAAFVASVALLGSLWGCTDHYLSEPDTAGTDLFGDGASCGSRCFRGASCVEGICYAPGEEVYPGYSLIPSGTFLMGSPETEIGRYREYEEQHTVVLSRSYAMKRTEVTQGEWREVMDSTPSYFATCGDDCPVERVSWWDALAFANALSRLKGLPECYALSECSGLPGSGCDEGRGHCWNQYSCVSVTFAGPGCLGYRLPTEAEWEWAARAGTTSTTYAGDPSGSECEDQTLPMIGWCLCNSEYVTHRVGGKRPNAWGLSDMLGNVTEWVWDYFEARPQDVIDPVGPPEPTSVPYTGRVCRGGNVISIEGFLRSASRTWEGSRDRKYDIGFRPVRTVP